jgi:hypothetical protein
LKVNDLIEKQKSETKNEMTPIEKMKQSLGKSVTKMLILMQQ